VDSISNIERLVEIPEEGPLCDLLWSDPVDNENGKFSNNSDNDFIVNNKRSCSYYFGKKAANKFLEKN
jgi:serine/threonine-protein phosphatase 2B catalytic subunit